MNSLNSSGRIDRLPPHSIEAEQGVLGCILLSPVEGLGECAERIQSSEVFYDLRHQHIYSTLMAMQDAGARIDEIAIHMWLKDRNELNTIGGGAYLGTLSISVPSAANLSYYLDILEEKFVARRLIQVCTGVVARSYERQDETEALLEEAEREVLAIRQARGTEECSTRQLVQSCIDDWEEAFQNRDKGILRGLPTGFAELDRLTSGFRDGQLIVVAARPAQGKSSLAMNIAGNVALDQKLPVAVFSLEMSPKELTDRLLCSRARVDLMEATRGNFREQDFRKLTTVSGQVAKSPLHIIDAGRPTVAQFRARARRLVQRHGIRLIVVDYLQLLRSGERRAENENSELTLVSNGLKATARELKIPILALAQLSREHEKAERKPRLSDLRGSGAIEQDADIVGLLHKPESAAGDSFPVSLIIAKHRSGPTGQLELVFHRRWTRFESAPPEEKL